jgi:hypothetical protein
VYPTAWPAALFNAVMVMVVVVDGGVGVGVANRLSI